jgi:enoyl-[acyl-carrier-protein] reductase (NADH)
MSALQAGSRPAEQNEGLGVGKAPLHGRAGQPAEIGPSYVFLASEAMSNAMTGQILHVNNGEHIGAS